MNFVLHYLPLREVSLPNTDGSDRKKPADT